jgi:hypothetical protein
MNRGFLLFIAEPIICHTNMQQHRNAALVEPGNPISRRALARLLNPQEIFLNRQTTWVLRAIGKSPVNSKSCAIIVPANGISGLN